MKNLMITALMVFVLFSTAMAQNVTTLWPYIYPEFQSGTLFLENKQEIKGVLNVHVYKSRLHFLENDLIKEAETSDIVLAIIGDDKYMVVDGRVMKVIGSKEKGFVALQIMGDFEQLSSQESAYGGQTTTESVNMLSSIVIGGINVTNHVSLRQDRENGLALPLKYKYYLVTKGTVYEATRRGILSKLDKPQGKEFKEFLKNHEVKWTDAESLLQIVDFFNKL
jgi:hypothetical protein